MNGLAQWPRLLGIALLAISAQSACIHSHPANPSTMVTSQERQVLVAVDTFVDCLNTLDLTRLMSMFTSDCTVFLPLPEQAVRAQGSNEVRRAFSDFFDQVRSTSEGPRYMNLKAEAVVIQLYGDTAVATFQTQNKYVVSRRTLVFRSLHGRWQIAHLHGSNIRPDAAEQAPEAKQGT